VQVSSPRLLKLLISISHTLQHSYSHPNTFTYTRSHIHTLTQTLIHIHAHALSLTHLGSRRRHLRLPCSTFACVPTRCASAGYVCVVRECSRDYFHSQSHTQSHLCIHIYTNTHVNSLSHSPSHTHTLTLSLIHSHKQHLRTPCIQKKRQLY
jgi:hypothetical protein